MDRGVVKSIIGNGEAKELICMNMNMNKGGEIIVEVYRAEGDKGEKKWDNCSSIINKIYFKKEKKVVCKLSWYF